MQQLNQEEFEKLFRANFKGLCFFAQKYVKDFETAREIVQDSFINLWEKRIAIDANRPVKTYLTTIIHNKCLNYLRDNQKFNHKLLEIENLIDISDIADSDLLVAKELNQAIHDAIEELPEKCREVFLLNRYENLKYKEIAVKLGISVKTVETQMSKALQHLRVRLAEYMVVILAIVTLVKLITECV